VKNNIDGLLLNKKDVEFFENKFILNTLCSSNKNTILYHNIYNYSFEKYLNNNKISYKINNEGFRCDDFDKNLKTELLFAGCSETFGMGGPLEDCWAYMLNNELSLKNYFNLGQPGLGYQAIIYNILSYIKEYGPPKVLFVLFPNIEREIIHYYPFTVQKKFNRYKFNKNEPQIYYNMPFPPVSETNYLKIPKKIKDDKNTYKKKLFSFYQTVLMFEEIMSLNNINFSWTTSTTEDMYNFNQINKFNNFINYSFNDYKDFMYEYIEKHKGVSAYKFDGHLGIPYHTFLKDIFLNGANL
jgi:hypothetical protein